MHNLTPNRWEPKAMREQPAPPPPQEDLSLACLHPFSLPPPSLPFAFFLYRHIQTRTCFSRFTSSLPSSVIHPGRAFPMCIPSPCAFLPRPSLQSKPATNPLTVPALIISCSPCTWLFHYGLTRMWGELGCQEWSLLTWVQPFPALMPPVPCPSVPGALSLFSPGENPSPDERLGHAFL